MLCDIFQLMLAKIFDKKGQFAPHLSVRIIRQQNAASFSETLEPCGNIYPVAKDIPAVNDDITNIDAYAELNPSVERYSDIALGHATLNINRTPDGVDNAAKLSQQPIARIFHNPPTVLDDFRIDERTKMFSEPDVSSLLVQARQAAISSHVCRQDRCQSSLQLSCDQGCAPSTTQLTPLD
jgi:hypothetical protein